ncbi:MAG: acyl-CoA dehydrogenase family protein, partial [Gemmatimonadetes bacterium]|nr:acyl-CoA dehydrogenase family protein [Gemmatimonadota bacterium]
MQRRIFEAEHDAFRAAFRTFAEREIAPFHAQWEKAGRVPRALWES